MDDANTKSRVILVTGFEPFGGQTVNPALEAVKSLPKDVLGFTIVPVQVPVSYSQAFAKVKPLVDTYKPYAVIMVGQAAGRENLSVERIAINVDDCEQPDNSDELRRFVPIDPSGPDGLFSTLPIQELARACEEAQIPVEISNTAGTYVCNHLMYEMLAYIKRIELPCIAGFVHVPLIPSQIQEGKMASIPSLPLETITRGLTVMLEAIVKHEAQ